MAETTQILYDGQCSLCQRAIARLRRRDTRHRLTFMDLHSVDVSRIHPSLTTEACLRDMHLVTPQGRVLSGFDAFRHIAAQLPAWRWWAPLLRVPPVPVIGRLIYRWIARRRHALPHRCASGRCAHPWHSGKTSTP